MAVTGFSNREVARKLKRLVQHGPDTNRLRPRGVESLIATSHIKHFLVTLDQAIPAASFNNTTGLWEVQQGTGKVLHRNQTGEEDNSQDPLVIVNDPGELIEWLDDNGLQIEKRVWNSQSSEAPANTILHAIQDEFGDLYIIRGGGTSTPIGVPFVNNSGETIPPGGVMFAEDSVLIGGVPYILAEKPSVFDRFWLINGPTPVAPLGTSLGSWLTDLTGFVAVASATVHNGISYGPKPGSFLLHDYRLGFTALENATHVILGQTVAYFKQHVITQLTGIQYEQLNQGSDADFEIWFRRSDGTPVVSGWNKINGRDGMYLNKDEFIEKDVTVTYEWYSGFWELRNAKCVKNNNDYYGSGSSQAASLGATQAAQSFILASQPIASPTGGALLMPLGLPPIDDGLIL